MKKISYLMLIIFMSLLIAPIVYAKGNVEIKSIELEKKSENIVINSEPTFKGLEMNFDLTFKKLGDYATYTVVVKNNSDKEFQISEDTSFNTSKYITYKYDVDKILKANGETTIHVTITYEKEVDAKLLASGKYSEKNKAVVQLQNEKVEEVNPNTGLGISIVVIVLFVASIAVAIVLNKKEFARYGLFVLAIACLVPMLVSAIETLKLTINVDIEIKKTYEVAYAFNGFVKETEKSQYDMTYADCYETYYIGEKKADNKYMLCNNILKKDEKVYAPGEKVDVKTVEVLGFINGGDTCENISDNTWLCNEELEIEKFNIDNWEYGYSRVASEEYPIFDDDNKTMKFTNSDGEMNWEDGIIFDLPATFTMPEHNVLFNLMTIG